MSVNADCVVLWLRRLAGQSVPARSRQPFEMASLSIVRNNHPYSCPELSCAQDTMEVVFGRDRSPDKSRRVKSHAAPERLGEKYEVDDTAASRARGRAVPKMLTPERTGARST